MKTHRLRLLPLLLCASLLACSPEEPAAPTPAATVKVVPPEPLPALRTGTRAVAQGSALTGELSGRFEDSAYEYLDIALAGESVLASADRLHVVLSNSKPGDLALLEIIATRAPAHLLVRRQRNAGDEPLAGAIYLRGSDAAATQRLTFVAHAAAAVSKDATLKTRWVQALASSLLAEGGQGQSWYAFASGRVQALLPGGLSAATVAGAEGAVRPTRRTELAQLMETTTGVLSMQEALQYDRGLRLDRKPEKRDIAVASLSLPSLDAHPFAAMQALLPAPQGGSPEPLAAAVPAEFWYARVDDIRLLLRLLDEADAWITPVVQVLQRNPEDRQLSSRYQAQLGLRRSGLAKLFGNVVVGQVAVAGSDAYLREGSDVTLIFSVKQQAIFDQELARHLDTYRAEFPDLTTTTREHAGVSISVSGDTGAHVRQQRAQVGDLAIVSNSATACDRVIDAILGKRARLSDEPDLRYLLARDPGAHQAYAFLSDKFIAAAISPPQKILAARRQQALAELLTPGYAALLHGWLYGQAPASTEVLIKSGLLLGDELKHADGSAISYTPGNAARSMWGSPAALTPLIDLPAVTQVSAAEQAAYVTFANGYQQYWKQFIDPVAIRLDFNEQAGTTSAEIDVRILPLISGTDYSEIAETVGDTRLDVAALPRGVQAVWAVGPNARLRSELDGLLHSATGQQDIGLGWLGSWVALGVDDRATLVELLSKLDHSVQLAPPPSPTASEFEDVELWRRVGRFPIYAAAEVKNPVMLIATLTAIRTMIGQVAPGMIEWTEAGKYRGLPLVRIGVSQSAPMLPNREIADAIALYYVQTGSAFVLALNPDTLHGVVDRLLDGKAPKAVPEGHAQFVFEGRSQVGAPAWTALLWLLQGQAYEAQSSARRAAEILLRGDPEGVGSAPLFAARAMNYLGYVPVSVQGDTAFTWTEEGAGDAMSGTTLAPNFVELPIKGAAITALMQRLTGLRGEISFDQEPAAAGVQARSLHTRFVVNLGVSE